MARNEKVEESKSEAERVTVSLRTASSGGAGGTRCLEYLYESAFGAWTCHNASSQWFNLEEHAAVEGRNTRVAACSAFASVRNVCVELVTKKEADKTLRQGKKYPDSSKTKPIKRKKKKTVKRRKNKKKSAPTKDRTLSQKTQKEGRGRGSQGNVYDKMKADNARTKFGIKFLTRHLNNIEHIHT